MKKHLAPWLIACTTLTASVGASALELSSFSGSAPSGSREYLCAWNNGGPVFTRMFTLDYTYEGAEATTIAEMARRGVPASKFETCLQGGPPRGRRAIGDIW